jgi:hypothetical protein
MSNRPSRHDYGGNNHQGNDPSAPSSFSSERPASLHPRVAVILGVDRKWYVPLLVCRALSIVPAAWWGLRCAFTFLAELLRIRAGMWREGWAAAIVGSNLADWDVERRFRVMEVALAIMWVCREHERGMVVFGLWTDLTDDLFSGSAAHPPTYPTSSWIA